MPVFLQILCTKIIGKQRLKWQAAHRFFIAKNQPKRQPAAKFRQNLPANAAGRHKRLCLCFSAGNRHGHKLPFPLADSLSQRYPLCADRRGIGGVFNITAGINPPALCQKRSSNTKFGIGRISLQARLQLSLIHIYLIYRTLRETGLNWDEGPDVGGDFGPYIQSERKDLYLEYAKQLINSGHAYYCFCDKKRLDELKLIHSISKVPHKYDGHCRSLSKEEIAEKLAAGVPYVIRQKIPETGTTTFFDEVYGEITVENSELDDQILIKTDGLPTYNFANVIDDHLMQITHVVRCV